MLDPVLEYDPAEQLEHIDDKLLSEYEPPAQFEQNDEDASANVPATHDPLKVTRPDEEQYVPGGQE